MSVCYSLSLIIKPSPSEGLINNNTFPGVSERVIVVFVFCYNSLSKYHNLSYPIKNLTFLSSEVMSVTEK